METRGGVLVRGLWERYTDVIITVTLGDTDMDTYMFKPMVTLLYRWDKTKKDKHGKH